MGERRKTRDGLKDGQLVMVRKQGPRGPEDVAWGTVVGGRPGKTVVRIEGCKPDLLTGAKEYAEGDVVEFRRTDGFVVSEARRPII
jgi:hypothetical protein